MGRVFISLIVKGKITKMLSITTTFEEKRELKQNQTEVLPFTSLMPYRWAKPVYRFSFFFYFISFIFSVSFVPWCSVFLLCICLVWLLGCLVFAFKIVGKIN